MQCFLSVQMSFMSQKELNMTYISDEGDALFDRVRPQSTGGCHGLELPR